MRLFLAVLALLVALPATAQQNFGFESLEKSLRLTPYQKQRFDAAVTATQRAMVAVGLGALQAKTRLAGELLKDRPDPNALFMAQEELVEFSKPHVRRARDEWLALYTTLDEDQVRIARAFVDEKLRLLEKAGEHLGLYLSDKLQKP